VHRALDAKIEDVLAKRSLASYTKRTVKQVKYQGGFGETALPYAGRNGSPSRPSIPPVSASEWYYSYALKDGDHTATLTVSTAIAAR
jgi:hypothetical protein